MSTNVTAAKSASTTTFTTALYINGAVFALELIAFTLLRSSFKSVYEPRTYIPPKSKRATPFQKSKFLWPWYIYKADYNQVRTQNGMDAYFFLRFLRMMVKMLLPIWLITWPILLPVDGVGKGNGATGLDRFTFGNVSNTNQTRLAAHFLLLVIITVWILYVLNAEMKHFVLTRQRYMVDPEHSASAKANTVLITGIPAKYLSESALTGLYNHLPGGVRKVWLNRDLRDLPELYDQRMTACKKLESAETNLMNTATKLHNKKLKQQAKADKKAGISGKGDLDPVAGTSRDGLTRRSTASTPTDPLEDREKQLKLAEQLVPANKRPTHRLPLSFLPFSLPLIGKKVDSIEWAREEIIRTNEALERGRVVLRQEVRAKREEGGWGGQHGIAGLVMGAVNIGGKRHHGRLAREGDIANAIDRDAALGIDSDADNKMGKAKAKTDKPVDGKEIARTSEETDNTHQSHATTISQDPDSPSSNTEGQTYPPLNSAFILFNRQVAAHICAQTLAHHAPYRMAAKYTEIAPQDIIWGNLGLNPYEIRVRIMLGWLATLGLVILWAFPIAFVGAVSNISALAGTYHWLSWLNKIPTKAIGVIQGILPPVLLAVLLMLVPIILRILARLEGNPTHTQIELSLMDRFFIFQVINGFLIVTLASGIIKALPTLVNNPSSIPQLLATNLPGASNFFLTYTLLQGLSGTAAGFLQIVPLILYYVKLFILGSTPRSIYGLKYKMRSVNWGTLFPSTTLLAVIVFAYCIISPIINGLACAAFFLFFQLWKYLFMFQLDQPKERESGGLFFPKAIQQLFAGVYIMQICLAALFFLARDDKGKPSAIPQGALTIILIAFTAFFHNTLNNSYGPLLHSLPLTLVDRSYAYQSADRQHERHENQMSDQENASDYEGHDANGRKGMGRRRASSLDGMRLRDYAHDDGARGHGGEGDARREHASRAQAGKDAQPAEDDFAHPASVSPQQVIWLPVDTLGLSKEEERENRALGIEVSSERARMDEKGHVDVTGAPPGEEYDEDED